jgi:sulfotransferase family protein
VKRIQLVGTQRSGSNMLRLMLGQLPGTLTPPSAHELRDFQPLIPKYMPLSEPANMERLIADLGRLIDLNALPWPDLPNRNQRVLGALAGSSLAHAIIAFYDAYANYFAANCWVSKCLENMRYADQLNATGLPISYVHLIRDPRDVAASFISAPIGPKDPQAVALKWREDQLEAERAHNMVGNQNWILIRYEDLVRAPKTTFTELCQIVGIDWTETVLDFHSSEAATTAAGISDLWRNLNRPIDLNRIGSHKTQLDERAIESIENMVRDLMERFGYTPNTYGPTVMPNNEERRRIIENDTELRKNAQTARDPESEHLHLRREYFLDSLKD